jgi:thiosulfate dehydrogenase [quinone] large subunit
VFTTSSVALIITFLVSCGHLLIGLSLLVGLMVRVSASFGIMLMLLYWMAHMDFSYIENRNNLSILRLLYGERHITGTGFRAVNREALL